MSLLDRRRLLLRALAMGVISPLAACNYEDPQHPDLADDFLHMMSYWNDRVQQALFNPHTLAPTFRAAQITNPPRFNAVPGYKAPNTVNIDSLPFPPYFPAASHEALTN